MLDKCSNSQCFASFRYLEQGRLFRVQEMGKSSARKSEYFWLCSDCSGKMTLHLGEGIKVITTGAPNSSEQNCAESGFIPLERKCGLLLSGLRYFTRAA